MDPKIKTLKYSFIIELNYDKVFDNSITNDILLESYLDCSVKQINTKQLFMQKIKYEDKIIQNEVIKVTLFF